MADEARLNAETEGVLKKKVKLKGRKPYRISRLIIYSSILFVVGVVALAIAFVNFSNANEIRDNTISLEEQLNGQ